VEEGFSGLKGLADDNRDAEIRQLKRELAGVTEERDILKKATAYFARAQARGVRRRLYKTRDEARKDIFDYIEMFYNPKRKHVINGMMSDIDYERQEKIS